MTEAASAAQAVEDPIDAALGRAEGTFRSVRMADAETTSAEAGTVRWKATKSVWIGSMTVATARRGTRAASRRAAR